MIQYRVCPAKGRHIKIGMSPSGKAPDFDSGISSVQIRPSQPYDPLAQLAEQLPFKQWVRGSNPRRVTKYASEMFDFRGVFAYSAKFFASNFLLASSRLDTMRALPKKCPQIYIMSQERYPMVLRVHTGFVTHCPRALPGYISKGSMLSTGWPTLLRYSRSCSGSSVQIVSSAIMSVKFSTPYSSSAEASSRSRT